MQRLVCVSNVYFNSATTLATFTILPQTMTHITAYLTRRSQSPLSPSLTITLRSPSL
jgi:hypothetical protein